MSRLLKPLALGVAVALAGLLAIVVAPWVDLEQEYGLPWLYWARGSAPVSDSAVIVAIDEQSAASLEVSQRPHDWPRTLHAELVRHLSRAGARLIVFDMTFDTPSPQPARDEELAAAFAAAGNVLVSESVRMDVLPLDDGEGKRLADAVVERAAPPIPVIAQALLGSAPFLVPKAARVDAYWAFRHGAKDAPTLPVLALRAWAAVGPPGASGPDAAEQQRVAATLARLEVGGDLAFLNLYGPPGSIRTLPYAQVLQSARSRAGGDAEAAIDDARLRGKAVFIGVFANTPAGQDRLRDDHRTVFSQDDGLNLSGVELAATAFANLLDDRPMRPLSRPWQASLAVLWAVVLGMVCGLLRPWMAAAAVGVLAAVWLGLVFNRFTHHASWWPSIVPIGIQLPLALFMGVWLQYRDTRRDRERMKETIGYYLPEGVVKQFVDGGRATDHANRVVYGTCLATDVSRYTSLAETMEPARLGKLLNAYFAELFVPVERSGGIVVDVVGDAMVALWTATATKSSLAVRRSACEAALEIVTALDRFNQASDRPALDTRFGLHCGDVLVGNVGASKHFEYRAVGDIINTASRLEGLNKLLGTRLLASASTLEGLDDMQTRMLGSFRLAGKANAVIVAELMGYANATDTHSQRMCAQFKRALDNYVAGRWRDAVEGFDRLLSEWPDDGPSRFYRERCAALLVVPGGAEADWSPTITLASK